jgi:protein disulfide-isomerase
MTSRMLTGLCIGIGIAVVFCARAEAADWQTDFAKAAKEAKTSGKYMLLDFSGSDWCGWCIKLDKEVFSQTEFKDYAKKNLVCVVLDFPRQKKLGKALKEQNDALAKKYAIEGYPTVIILSPEGDVVVTTGYRPDGPKKYVEYLTTTIADYKAKHPPKEAEKPANTTNK